MRTGTSPLFPASTEGAVTLNAVIETREGDRLPLELALYVSLEVSKQVARLHALGKGAGALGAKTVWCLRDGRVVVGEHEAGSQRDEVHALGRLVYRLLSGSDSVSEWPPSYFNPGVDAELDAVVMSTLSSDPSKRPYSAHVLVEAVGGVFEELDLQPSPEGLQRLVLAVPDEEPAAPVVEAAPVKPAPAPAPAPVPKLKPHPRPAPEAVESQFSQEYRVPQRQIEIPAWLAPMLTPTRLAVAGVGVLVLLLTVLAWPSKPSRAAQRLEAEPVAAQETVRPAVQTPKLVPVAKPASSVAFKKADKKKAFVARR